jgi:hypothetical protein
MYANIGVTSNAGINFTILTLAGTTTMQPYSNTLTAITNAQLTGKQLYISGTYTV